MFVGVISQWTPVQSSAFRAERTQAKRRLPRPRSYCRIKRKKNRTKKRLQTLKKKDYKNYRDSKITGNKVVFIVGLKKDRNINEMNLTRLRFPTGWRQISWLFTSMAQEWSQDYREQFHRANLRKNPASG